LRLNFKPWLAVLLGFGITLLLSSCGSSPKVEEGAPGSSPDEADGPSSVHLTADQVREAVPRNEPLASYGNHSPYEVFGKKYTVMKTSKGYYERGVASWYGSKFHGRRTSSGEPYDMHLASAAHKTLPLPTYAEVTNLDNGRKIIVKINDRGPFKRGRIIDMSYGAAIKLDMIRTGTANVEVRAIDTSNMPLSTATDLRVASADSNEGPVYLQVGAFGSKSSARELVDRLEDEDLEPVNINKGSGVYRVWLGPYTSALEVDRVIQRAIELGFERPYRVKP
jgi:rare lipoprotein A